MTREAQSVIRNHPHHSPDNSARQVFSINLTGE